MCACAHEGQKRMLDLLRLELLGSYEPLELHARKETLLLHKKSSNCSPPLRHLSCPPNSCLIIKHGKILGLQEQDLK